MTEREKALEPRARPLNNGDHIPPKVAYTDCGSIVVTAKEHGFGPRGLEMTNQKDFSAIPTSQLAAETIERSRDVGALQDAAFLWVGYSLIGVIIAALIGMAGMAIGVLMLGLAPPMAAFLALSLTVLTAAYPIARWWGTIRDLRAYTAECKARAAELQKRRAAISAARS